VSGVPAEAMLGWRPLVWQGAEQAAMWYDRDKLLPGNTLSGPALVAETSATTFLPPGASAEVDGFGNLVINVDGGRAATA